MPVRKFVPPVPWTVPEGVALDGPPQSCSIAWSSAAESWPIVSGDTLVELVFGEEIEELGEDGATFVHKVKNRWIAVKHPRRAVAELKSENDQTAKKARFYRADIVIIKTLTGQ